MKRSLNLQLKAIKVEKTVRSDYLAQHLRTLDEYYLIDQSAIKDE